MKWAEKLYLRCMIKSPLLFFSMLILVIASFILLISHNGDPVHIGYIKNKLQDVLCPFQQSFLFFT